MVTAWSPWRIVRARSDAGALLRVLTLAVLLFSVLVTHGVHGESADHNLSTSAKGPTVLSANGVRHAAVEPAPVSAAEADDHRGGHGPSHPGEHCLSGQPPQGSFHVCPCFAVSVGEPASADDSIVRASNTGGPLNGASPATPRAASVVQQV
jgi:hypothetical protein